MSVFEPIYFRADITPDEAAQAIADALGCDIEHTDHGTSLGRFVEGIPEYFGGKIGQNFDAEQPGDEYYTPSGYDGYSLTWDVFKNGLDEPGHRLQKAGARVFFHEIVTKLRWPALLTHDAKLAIAVWDPEHGLREFPEDTPIDAEIVISATPRPEPPPA